MSRIVVVGIGADGMAGLRAASRDELARATVIYGSPRQLDLLDDTRGGGAAAWPSPMLPALRRCSTTSTADVHVRGQRRPDAARHRQPR